MSLITDNAYILVLAVILIAVAVYVFKKGKAGLYSAALYLVAVAEEEWGSKTGKIKFAKVITTLKKTYPIISLFIRENKLEELIEKALVDLKVILGKKQSEEDTKTE